MSTIESLVLEHLGKQPELEAFKRGVLWRRDHGETRLWFQSTTATPDELGLCATAFIETIFHERLCAPDEAVLARLNQRAVFGSFFGEDGRLGVRASYCIYEKEPASQWVALILLKVMGEQLALSYGIAECEFAPERLPYNRSNLEYPRRWAKEPDSESITATAERFTERGLASTFGRHGLVLEVPLDGGSATTRMVNPKAETALLHVSVDTPHPIAGVGYLATIALPYDPPSESIPAWCRFLNHEEHKMQDFVPRLGAWGVRGLNNELVYSMFWPTDQASIDFGTVMNWMVQRTFWLRTRYWLVGGGLTKEQADG
jgi:hypothetical protein